MVVFRAGWGCHGDGAVGLQRRDANLKRRIDAIPHTFSTSPADAGTHAVLVYLAIKSIKIQDGY